MKPRGAAAVIDHPPEAAPSPPIEAPEPTPAPVDAIPLQVAPHVEGTIVIAFRGTSSQDRLLDAVSRVNETLKERPGPCPVVLSVHGIVQGARMPYRAAWDPALSDALRRLGDGIDVDVSFRPQP